MLALGHSADSRQSAGTCCPGLAAVRHPDRPDRCLRMHRCSNQHASVWLTRFQTSALTFENRYIAARTTCLPFLSGLGSLSSSHSFGVLPLQPPPDQDEANDGQDNSANAYRDDKVRVVEHPAAGGRRHVRVSCPLVQTTSDSARLADSRTCPLLPLSDSLLRP